MRLIYQFGTDFSAPAGRGMRTAAGGFALSGRQSFFCTGCAGHTNCRRRVRPIRAECFPLNLSGGFAAAAAGTSRRPPRGQKGRTTCGFPSSLNSYLSLASQSGADCLHVTAPKIGERQSGYLSVCFATYSQFTDRLLLHIRATLRWVRHKVNCPKGKRGSPGG